MGHFSVEIIAPPGSTLSGNQHALLASVAASAFWSSSALAQEAVRGASEDDQDAIVVTARRENEAIQNVPVTVQAISGETLKQLGIVQAEELSKIAPGLNLQPVGTGGANAGITLRGVRWAACRSRSSRMSSRCALPASTIAAMPTAS